MGPTLPFPQAVQRRVPAVRAKSRGVIQGHAGVVAELAAGQSLLLIFVITHGPMAREVDLGGRRRTEERRADKEREADAARGAGVVHWNYWNVPFHLKPSLGRVMERMRIR